MNTIVDVFPEHPSSEPLSKLAWYPEKNFVYWRYKTLSTGEQKQIFIYFMNAINQVYYLKIKPFEKTDHAVVQIGKGCQYFDKKKFDPSRLNFANIKKRLKKDTDAENRMNADTRLAFKLGNQYLVKHFFTSGLRTVKPGTAHVVQTLRVPVLLYLKPKRKTSKYFPSSSSISFEDEKIFPYERLHLYNLSILPPMTANRIPPGTRYVMLTVQKTFFTFDVVHADYEIPFAYRDPVKQRLTKLPGCGNDYLDKPVKTPYIENVPSDPEEDLEQQQRQILFPPQQDEQQQNEQFYHQQQIIFPQQQQQDEQMQIIFSDEQQQQQQQIIFPSTIFIQQQTPLLQEPQQTPLLQDEQQQQQQRQTDTPLQDEHPFMSPPPQERTVIYVSVNFAETYRRLKESNRLDSEPRVKIPFSYDCYKPLDLSSTATTTTTTAAAAAGETNECELITLDGDILQQATAEIFKDELMMQELDNLLNQPQNPDIVSSYMDDDFLNFSSDMY